MVSKAEKLAIKIFGSNLKKPRVKKTGKFLKKYKLVCFVPVEKTDELTFALAAAGAGNIGNYSVCSFRTKGVGTFMGNESSNPEAGTKGKFEMVDETRIEMICDKKSLNNIVKTIFEVHPYDEPAYEIYRVITKEKPRDEIFSFDLKKKIPAKELFEKINPKIDYSGIKSDLKNMKINKGVIDCSGSETKAPEEIPDGTIYITKNKKIIKAYIK